MKPLFFFALLFVFGTASAIASETEEEKLARETRVKARLAEHARAKAERNKPKARNTAARASIEVKEDETVMTLPELVISSRRISELDIEIKKLDRKIEKQRKKIKPTDLDSNLNSSKAPKILSIFGGNTSEQREAIAYERVSLMEAERDILEAMKYVRTRKEQKQLKAQLNAITTMRRQLDENLR